MFLCAIVFLQWIGIILVLFWGSVHVNCLRNISDCVAARITFPWLIFGTNNWFLKCEGLQVICEWLKLFLLPICVDFSGSGSVCFGFEFVYKNDKSVCVTEGLIVIVHRDVGLWNKHYFSSLVCSRDEIWFGMGVLGVVINMLFAYIYIVDLLLCMCVY